ncbi:hypothetical protein TNCV_2861491 [Trichonephila clavipes]|nr:hypothetical protein TNCV_2861491 [Trichonephila clavipes]
MIINEDHNVLIISLRYFSQSQLNNSVFRFEVCTIYINNPVEAKVTSISPGLSTSSRTIGENMQQMRRRKSFSKDWRFKRSNLQF